MTLESLVTSLLIDGPVCRFGSRGEMRRWLTALVVAGKKTATAGLLADYEVEGEVVPGAGSRSLVVDDDEMVIGVLITVRLEQRRLADVPWEFAEAEGEGFTGVGHWRSGHEAFWQRESVPLIRQLRDPGFVLDDDTIVVCEWFTFERLTGPVPWPGPPDLAASGS